MIINKKMSVDDNLPVLYSFNFFLRKNDSTN
jgi:hypothetical protein